MKKRSGLHLKPAKIINDTLRISRVISSRNLLDGCSPQNSF